ncbi:MAG: threonine aldolase [Sphingobacteriaceae bacterium]|nr:threonine aldolase [Sphingobacteriaceae bacterium]
MIIDLRSDTVTKPSQAMMEEMMSAELGDDVFNEDPTVNKLEEYSADLFSKEAALFCPSGTMTNQIAIKVHTQPGDELICDVNSHIYNYEGGGISFNSGVQAKLLEGMEGRLNASQIENVINGRFDWLTRTSLVSLENTVNRAGGSYYTLELIKPIRKLCNEKKLKLHLDGARIFNALIETKEKPKQIGENFDSISICLSKGLGAPVGSLLLGSKDFISNARRVRKVFGGGMRQAGILAAAGLFALKNNIPNLKFDHANAKLIEVELKKINFITSVLPVYTNILIFTIDEKYMTGEEFVKKLDSKNIKVVQFGKQIIRMVTHMDFSASQLDVLSKSLRSI